MFNRKKPSGKGLRLRGVTLVEVMMVLGVMAFMLGAVMTIYSFTAMQSKANTTVEGIYNIADVVNEFMMNAGQDAWANDKINPTAVVQSGLISSRFVNKDKNGAIVGGRNAFVFPSGGVTGTVVGNGGQTYAIYLWNVRPADCVAILSSVANPDYFAFIQVSWFQLGSGQSWFTWPDANSISYSCRGFNPTTMIFVVNPGMTGGGKSVGGPT